MNKSKFRGETLCVTPVPQEPQHSSQVTQGTGVVPSVSVDLAQWQEDPWMWSLVTELHLQGNVKGHRMGVKEERVCFSLSLRNWPYGRKPVCGRQ